jgi:hypothetical protein
MQCLKYGAAADDRRSAWFSFQCTLRRGKHSHLEGRMFGPGVSAFDSEEHLLRPSQSWCAPRGKLKGLDQPTIRGQPRDPAELKRVDPKPTNHSDYGFS